MSNGQPTLTRVDQITCINRMDDAFRRVFPIGASTGSKAFALSGGLMAMYDARIGTLDEFANLLMASDEFHKCFFDSVNEAYQNWLDHGGGEFDTSDAWCEKYWNDAVSYVEARNQLRDLVRLYRMHGNDASEEWEIIADMINKAQKVVDESEQNGYPEFAFIPEQIVKER